MGQSIQTSTSTRKKSIRSQRNFWWPQGVVCLVFMLVTLLGLYWLLPGWLIALYILGFARPAPIPQMEIMTMTSELTPDDFDALVTKIAQLNSIDTDLASDYLLAIGSTPEADSQGRVIIRDQDDSEIARIRYPIDED